MVVGFSLTEALLISQNGQNYNTMRCYYNALLGSEISMEPGWFKGAHASLLQRSLNISDFCNTDISSDGLKCV